MYVYLPRWHARHVGARRSLRARADPSHFSSFGCETVPPRAGSRAQARAGTCSRHATLVPAPMHHIPHPFPPARLSSAPLARACSCAKLEPSRVPCTPFRQVLATPGVAGDDSWRNLYVQNGAVSTGLLSSCDPASFIDAFAID